MAKSPYTAVTKDRCRNCRVCTGFGRQVPSDQRTEPATVIGSGLRDDAAKQYISAGHSKATGGNYSRGPVYNLEDSFGAQRLSLRPNSASYSLASSAYKAPATRCSITAILSALYLLTPAVPIFAPDAAVQRYEAFVDPHRLFPKQVQRPKEGKGRLPGPGEYRVKGDLEPQALSTRLTSPRVSFPIAPKDLADKVYSGAYSETAFIGKESPGPLAYDQHCSGMGRQAMSARSNAPECHIGQADRFRQSREADFGTGLFQHQGSLGPQGISTRPSLPSYSLGVSTRDQMYKAFLTRRHEKTGVLGGGTGPGPSTAVPQSSLGPQRTSLHTSGSRWSFSHSRRMGASNSEGTPGPGTYCV